MADSDNEIGAFLTGFIIGGLVGAAVALVTAPQSGEETRMQLRERSIELRDRAVETAEETRRQAEEALGHNSKAVHIAYAKRAQVTVASLEAYEEMAQKSETERSPNDFSVPTARP